MPIALLVIALIAVVYLGTRLFTRETEFKKLSAQNAELITVLFNLEERPLEDLLALYKKEFGPSAARYARHTYLKWKAGKVRPNRQTFARFLMYLPAETDVNSVGERG